MTSIKTVAAVALAALLVPVAAVAKEAAIEGPQAVKGSGFFRAELKQAGGDEQRSVRINGRGGYVGFLDLGGDLKVRCVGRGRVHEKETDEGTVYLCAGRGGAAVAKGSHFKLRGFALRYRALFPAGTTGTFDGNRFAACTKTDEGWSCEQQQRPERPGKTERPGAKERPERPGAKERTQPVEGSEDAEVPTLSELSTLLAGQDG